MTVTATIADTVTGETGRLSVALPPIGSTAAGISYLWDTEPGYWKYLGGVASALKVPLPGPETGAGAAPSSGWSAADISSLLAVGTPMVRIATMETQTTWPVLDFERSFIWSYATTAEWIKARLALGSYAVTRPTVYLWNGNWLTGGPDGKGLKAGLAALGLTFQTDYDIFIANQDGVIPASSVYGEVACQFYGASQAGKNGVPSGAYVDCSRVFDTPWAAAVAQPAT